MPYKIEKRDSKWCVVKEAQGQQPQETVHCHNTEHEAERQLTAVRIAETARR
jgi:hypothetical protein